MYKKMDEYDLTPSANAFDVLRARKRPTLLKPNEHSAPQSAKFIQMDEELSKDQFSTLRPDASNTVSDGDICLIAMKPNEVIN